MKKRLSIAFMAALILILALPSIALAGEEDDPDSWKVISNTINATVIVEDSGDGSEVEVGDYNELIAAIANENVDKIVLKQDISSQETIKLDRSVAIDGAGYSLTFSGLTNREDGLLITASGVTVENLIVEAGLGADKLEVWQGTYAIQVYDASNVTLKDVTATGANGGILVNGSVVTLQGDIDVSGNGFGGIEVSYGQGLEGENLKLNVNEADIINSSEEPGKPTIWEDLVVGHVIGIDGYHSIRVFNQKDENQPQVHYYLEKENLQFISLEWVSKPESVTESTFEVQVKAEKVVKNVSIPNVVYIVEVEGGNFEAVELVDGEKKQKLGRDENGGFWYWGALNNNGFTMNFDEATTTFEVTADPGNYEVKVYAVQLDAQ